jgi:hypothetical protein
MSSRRGNAFRKTRRCPSVRDLLLSLSREVAPPSSDGLKNHLAGCDFCSAELHFLSTHPPAQEIYEPVPMPAHLHGLAEGLLVGNQMKRRVLLETLVGGLA